MRPFDGRAALLKTLGKATDPCHPRDHHEARPCNGEDALSLLLNCHYPARLLFVKGPVVVQKGNGIVIG